MSLAAACAVGARGGEVMSAAQGFSSDAGAGAPSFRLGYRPASPGVPAVSFGMVPSGGGAPRPVAESELRKAP